MEILTFRYLAKRRFRERDRRFVHFSSFSNRVLIKLFLLYQMQNRNMIFKNEIASEFCSVFMASLVELILRKEFDCDENVIKIFLFKNNLFLLKLQIEKSYTNTVMLQ